MTDPASPRPPPHPQWTLYPPGGWWLWSSALPWPYLPRSCWSCHGRSHRCTPRCSRPPCRGPSRLPPCRSPVLTAALLVAVHLVAAVLAGDILVVYLAAVVLNVVLLILIPLAAAVLTTVLSPSPRPPSPQPPLPQSFSSSSSQRSCLCRHGRRRGPTRLIVVYNF